MATRAKSKTVKRTATKPASIRARKPTERQRAIEKKADLPKADILDLARYEIGTRLRHARLMQGARLKDVADQAGCSESLVSKIENNKLEPSLQVLG
jgi:ribosome-binding protein aMBF1 (putative translation factor)